MSLSPHIAPALSDDDGAPVRDLSHWGRHSGWGETLSERSACDWAFFQIAIIKKNPRIKA
jgi:hypothetical protein